MTQQEHHANVVAIGTASGFSVTPVEQKMTSSYANRHHLRAVLPKVAGCGFRRQRRPCLVDTSTTCVSTNSARTQQSTVTRAWHPLSLSWVQLWRDCVARRRVRDATVLRGRALEIECDARRHVRGRGCLQASRVGSDGMVGPRAWHPGCQPPIPVAEKNFWVGLASPTPCRVPFAPLTLLSVVTGLWSQWVTSLVVVGKNLKEIAVDVMIEPVSVVRGTECPQVTGRLHVVFLLHLEVRRQHRPEWR